jgi:copper resistance protein C
MDNKLQIYSYSGKMSGGVKGFVACLLVIIGLTVLQVHDVWAHASLVKSDPPRRSTLAESPSKVQLWFNEEIETAYAAVSVVDVNDKVVSQATPEKVADDPKSIILALPELVAGAYKVQFRVLSIDGHVVDSSYSFRIKDSSQ